MINLPLRKVAANTEPDDSERQTDVSSFSQMYFDFFEMNGRQNAPSAKLMTPQRNAKLKV